MPPELLELYGLYQQELASRNEKEANYLTELNVMLRVREIGAVYEDKRQMKTFFLQSPSMLSLRGPEFDDRKLPPIRQEEDSLFQRPDYRDNEYMRADSRLSITSPERCVVINYFDVKLYCGGMSE